MLMLRNAQLASLERSVEENFVRRAVAHLREFFPEKIEKAGELRAQELVRRTLERAREYDIVSERHVCLFLDLIVTFGWNFDRTYPWARHLLTEPGYGEPATRVELLFEAALREIGPGSAVAGQMPRS